MASETPKASWRIPPHKKRQLLVDIAIGELTDHDIALKYGCTDGNIAQYRSRHLEKIMQYKAEFDAGVQAKLVGLWIADKAQRLEVIQDLAERLEASMEDDKPLDPSTTKILLHSLRQAAEELNDLKQNVQAEVRYEIVGVDPSDVT